MTRRNASIDLPPTAGSVSVARHLVLELLRAWGVPHDREDAALLGLSHDRPRGRGIRMVQAIADRWGTDAHGSGKRVWLELRPLGR